MTQAVSIRDVTKTYSTAAGPVEALHPVDLQIEAGEFICLLGPSGCGKSSLLRMIAGLSLPTSGTMAVLGVDVRGPGPERAVVFQDYALFPWLTVRSNVEFGLEARGVDAAARAETARRLLALVGLRDFSDRYPHELSGGMRQRVSIARALAVDPDLLLMDEPFGALDAQTRSVMQRELLQIWETDRKTVIFVTHSVDEALYLSDKVVVMTARPGRIKEVIALDTPRPRDLTDGEMIAAKRRILALLSQEVERSLEQESHAISGRA